MCEIDGVHEVQVESAGYKLAHLEQPSCSVLVGEPQVTCGRLLSSHTEALPTVQDHTTLLARTARAGRGEPVPIYKCRTPKELTEQAFFGALRRRNLAKPLSRRCPSRLGESTGPRPPLAA